MSTIYMYLEFFLIGKLFWLRRKSRQLLSNVAPQYSVSEMFGSYGTFLCICIDIGGNFYRRKALYFPKIRKRYFVNCYFRFSQNSTGNKFFAECFGNTYIYKANV